MLAYDFGFMDHNFTVYSSVSSLPSNLSPAAGSSFHTKKEALNSKRDSLPLAVSTVRHLGAKETPHEC